MNIATFFNLKTLVVTLALAVLGVLGFAGTVRALPQDCDPNSIINCGVQSREEFRAKYNSSSELQKLYAHPMFNQAAGAGLQGNDIDRFVANSQQGKLCKNGELTLDNGQKVMTNGWSMGRLQHGNPYRYPINIDTGANNNTYYYGTTQNSFGRNTTCLPVWVLFNDQGEVEFSLLTACGNINWGDSVKPKYSCDKLNASPVKDKKDTYLFTTDATATNNANIVKVIYDFGDGSAPVERTNKDQKFAYEYQYKKPGTFNAKVTVVVSLPGGNTKTVTSEQCTKPIKVEEEKKPFFTCKELTGIIAPGKTKEDREYVFTAITDFGDGPVFKSADFDFGDGQKAENIAPKTAKTASVQHKYSKDLVGEVTITATVYFTHGNDTKNAKCTYKLNFEKPPVTECPEKPGSGLPVGHPDCKGQVLPAEIVKTGPAELAAGALGLGGLAGAGMYYRASRRNLLDKIFKR